VRAQRLFGEPDYLLRVRCRDAADYQRIRDTRLAALPGVGRLNSTLVMKDVIRDRALERSIISHLGVGARASVLGRRRGA
jgi:DNA-binding Lrp family transcriptional regulator